MLKSTLRWARSALLLIALAPLTNVAYAESPGSEPPQKRCLYISSYHRGYQWSDEIEASIRDTLGDACEIRQIDMDTHRDRHPEQIFAITNRVIKTIDDWQPDIVITSDDNAVKHIVTPHYKDDAIPFVFCGVNWTVEEYGLPVANVTGIVEVAPVRTMLEHALRLSDGKNRALYIGASTLSEKKNFSMIKKTAEAMNVSIEPVYVPHFVYWQEAMSNTEDYDFVILGGNAGIEAWDDAEALNTAININNRIALTNHRLMMPYAAFGFTTIASEQGNWAASVALQILNGVEPATIPLASNKKWDIWANEIILSRFESYAGRKLLRKAKRIKAKDFLTDSSDW